VPAGLAAAAATFDYYLASLGTTNSSCKLWIPSTGVNISAGWVVLLDV